MAPKIPRVQEVVLPILREALPDVNFRTWVDDVDYREYPMVMLRRLGGVRHAGDPTILDLPVLEITAFTNVGLIETEDLYNDVLDTLYEAVRNQTQTEKGWLHSIEERMGMTQFSSLFTDSWRSQGLVALGVRPPRN